MSELVLAVVCGEACMLAAAWWAYHEGRRTSVAEAMVVGHWHVARRLVLVVAALLAYLGRGLAMAWVRIDPGYRMLEGVGWIASRATRRVVAAGSATAAARSGEESTSVGDSPLAVSFGAASVGPGEHPGARRRGSSSGAVAAVVSGLGIWVDRLVAAAAGCVVGGILGFAAGHLMGDYSRERMTFVAGAIFGAIFGWYARGMEPQAGSGGMATPAQLRRTMSASAVRRTAAITRPSLDRAGRAPVREYGVELAKSGGVWLYATMRDIILLVAPPQTGKTALLGNTVIDAPGAVVATSTKPDIVEHTAALRTGSIMVLNPEGLAGLPSSFRWSPIEGCDHAAVAIERAGYVLAGAPDNGGVSDRNFWDGMNAELLRSLLYAAAVAGRDMHTLVGWISDPMDETPLRILQRHPHTPFGWAAKLEQIRQAPQKTRDSAYLTLALAFEWMADPELARAACPAPGEETFDVDRFLKERGTLYLLGSERRHGGLGPLFTALTGHIHERAKWLASQRRHGRLDPPLTMVLDEAALICPVPLERWTSDAGGRGIVLAIAVQSPSQLYDRWGQRGGETIWNNANITLVFGGLGVAKDLDDLSSLCGERIERTHSQTVGSDRRRSTTSSERHVRAMTSNAIRELPDWHVLVLRRNTPPAIGRIRPVWDRRDVKRVRRAGVDLVDILTPAQRPPNPPTADNIVPLPVARVDDEQADKAVGRN
jgi:type IV secretion system protein VirD4